MSMGKKMIKEIKRIWPDYLSGKKKEYSNAKKTDAVLMHHGHGRSWNSVFAACLTRNLFGT